MRSSPSRTSPTPAVRGVPTRCAPEAMSSERPARDPFAKQRIDHHVPLTLFHDEILLAEGRQRSLHARGPPKPMPSARVDREQFAPILQDDGAQHGALRESQALPDRFKYRFLFREQ